MSDHRIPERHAGPSAVGRRERHRRSPAEQVVEKLAAARGVEPVEMDRPLNDSIDPDALDAIFAPRHDGAPRTGDGYVEFSAYGYRVRVRKNGTVRLARLEPPV